MARVELNKNKDSILAAHKEVSNPNGKNNWALFTYEGKTNVLKHVESGDGGLEELVDELSSGKIMYAYLRVTDSNTGLPKLVLINWQGEGVPEVKKGSCANHIRDIESLLRGAHVTIMARTEDDLDEDDVMKKVSKSSGSNYSFHKETAKPMEPSGPVGSNYKRTVPQQELISKKREDFWEKQQEEEKKRLEAETVKRNQERATLDKERREREEREDKERNERERERVAKIRQMREAEFKAIAPKPSVNKDASTEDAAKDAEERSKRSEQMRKERAAEAKNLIGGSQKSARSVFEQSRSQFNNPNKTAPPPPRKLKHSFLSQESEGAQPQQRKQPIDIPRGEPEVVQNTPIERPADPEPTPAPVQTRRQPSPPPARQPSPPPVRQPSPPPARAPSPPPARQPSPPPARQPSPPPVQQPPSDGPKTRNLLSEGLPPRQDSDKEESDDDWGDDNQPALAPVAPLVQESVPEPELPPQEPVRQPEPEMAVSQPEAEPASAVSGGQGLVAKALYDYQAGEENEISFDPGEMIMNIEMIDSGWWLGTNPSGAHGMFPANFVELVDGGAGDAAASQAPAQAPAAEPAGEDLGMCARAEFDYQAEDDGEITFDPGDVITNIEQIDDGWWSGKGPDGSTGIFPANYVKLIANN